MSDDTHITLRQLQSLEDGRYGDLPGGMYNRAFIRMYCTYLGLEPEGFVARYEEESAPRTEKTVKAKPRPEPVPVKSWHVPQVLIWGIMLLASVVGVYFSHDWIAQVFSPYFAQAPAARIPLPPPTPATTPAQPKEALTLQTAPPAANPPADQAQPAAATEAAAPVPAEPPAGTIRLSFEVVDPCWMSLTSDGTRVYSDTLQPGSTPFFDAKEQFEMVLGNAGGIKLKINGKPAKPLGAPGAVIKLLINAASIPELLEKTGG